MNIGRIDVAGEQRESRRAFFTLEDNFCASIAFPGNDVKPVPVTVLSISEGGISILGTRCKLPAIHVGDRLLLIDIHTPEPLGIINQVKVAVKYMVDDNRRARLSLGCEFLEIPGRNYRKIHDFVRKRMIKMGLTN